MDKLRQHRTKLLKASEEGEFWGGERYYWWLRSPGDMDIDASYVYSYGYVDNSGAAVSVESGVRPALCLEF